MAVMIDEVQICVEVVDVFFDEKIFLFVYVDHAEDLYDFYAWDDLRVRRTVVLVLVYLAEELIAKKRRIKNWHGVNELIRWGGDDIVEHIKQTGFAFEVNFG